MSESAAEEPEAEPDWSTLAGRMLRAVRYHREVSQRELAGLAGVRRETLERIEGDRVVPRFDTLLTLLAGVGFGLALVDHRGRLLELDPDRDKLFDHAGRHLPPHLRPEPTPRYMAWSENGTWWGWHRIAWAGDTRRVPAYTYWHRTRREVVSLSESTFHRIWDDAT